MTSASRLRGKLLRSTTAVAITLLLAPGQSVAAGKLTCQNISLVAPGASCTPVTGKWNPASKLHVTGSCRECTGSGSNINCGTTEMVTAGNLTVETLATKKVAGSFAKIGSCAFSVNQFAFSGTLAGGTQYNLVADITGHGRTLLLAFSTSGTSTSGDGGGTTGDGGGTTGDGGGTSTGDGGGTSTGDGGGTSGADGDDGCSCRVDSAAARGGALFSTVLLLCGLLAARRRSAR